MTHSLVQQITVIMRAVLKKAVFGATPHHRRKNPAQLNQASGQDSSTPLRLREATTPVMRLSRPAILSLCCLACLLIAGMTLVALKPPRAIDPAHRTELIPAAKTNRAQGFESLPDSYDKIMPAVSSVPKLGPPLPGDLGPALLKARQTGHAPSVAAYATASQTINQTRQHRDRRYSGTSHDRLSSSRGADTSTTAAHAPILFDLEEGNKVSQQLSPSVTGAHLSARRTGIADLISPEDSALLEALTQNAAPRDANDTPVSSLPQKAMPSGAGYMSAALQEDVQGSPDMSGEYVSSTANLVDTNVEEALAQPPTGDDIGQRSTQLYRIMAGTLIPASLITGIQSDLPGMIVAQVTENVFDTVTGQHLMIPHGAKLIGSYDSKIGAAQERVRLIWHRLIRPDGTSLDLVDMPGTDTQGLAGIADQVDWHTQRLAKGALLATILQSGAQIASDRNESTLARAVREGLQGTVDQTAKRVIDKQIDVPPTITIRPGAEIRVIVTRDLSMDEYAFTAEGTP
jgi:type IV secretion system protein TrbI